MENILDYIDYRVYLAACFNEIKNIKANIRINYSYEAFAHLLRINNRSYLWDVMNMRKKKQLAEKYWDGVAEGLKLSPEQAGYLKNIIAYTHAREEGKQSIADYYYQQAMNNKIKSVTPAFQLRKDHYEYYSKWYHSAIRAYIELTPFKDDYLKLSRSLSPSITEMQAKKSVQLLKRLGLIDKGNDGVYHITQIKIKAGDEITQTVRNRFHVECTELAKNAIMDHSPETRNTYSLTIGISKQTYEIISEETRQFKDKIMELASNDKKADRVYQYQLVFFPLMIKNRNR
jgi:uncharacterized protein (TIGR02147 family)